MVIEYGKLDARYWPTKDPLVMSISFLELGVMGPLCILWYVLRLSFNFIYLEIYYLISYIHTRRARDWPLVIALVSCQCGLGLNPCINAICG